MSVVSAGLLVLVHGLWLRQFQVSKKDTYIHKCGLYCVSMRYYPKRDNPSSKESWLQVYVITNTSKTETMSHPAKLKVYEAIILQYSKHGNKLLEETRDSGIDAQKFVVHPLSVWDINDLLWYRRPKMELPGCLAIYDSVKKVNWFVKGELALRLIITRPGTILHDRSTIIDTDAFSRLTASSFGTFNVEGHRLEAVVMNSNGQDSVLGLHAKLSDYMSLADMSSVELTYHFTPVLPDDFVKTLLSHPVEYLCGNITEHHAVKIRGHLLGSSLVFTAEYFKDLTADQQSIINESFARQLEAYANEWLISQSAITIQSITFLSNGFRCIEDLVAFKLFTKASPPQFVSYTFGSVEVCLDNESTKWLTPMSIVAELGDHAVLGRNNLIYDKTTRMMDIMGFQGTYIVYSYMPPPVSFAFLGIDDTPLDELFCDDEFPLDVTEAAELAELLQGYNAEVDFGYEMMMFF